MNAKIHYVNGRALHDDCGELVIQDEESLIQFGMGCFWGAERKFWVHPNVSLTAAGYAGGANSSGNDNPSYEAVCSGTTGHAEVVAVVFAGGQETLVELLKIFWESHDPTQGMRQGNDIGTQYRSAIYCSDDSQYRLSLQSRDVVQSLLAAKGYAAITTEIALGRKFYLAEDYHQQYLAKNPQGYCGLGGTGIRLADALDKILEAAN